jgi:hypothetical protein
VQPVPGQVVQLQGTCWMVFMVVFLRVASTTVCLRWLHFRRCGSARTAP